MSDPTVNDSVRKAAEEIAREIFECPLDCEQGNNGFNENCFKCIHYVPDFTAIIARHWEEGDINTELEMRALDAEMIAMQEANIERDFQGHSHAYGSESFFEIAERYRKLKEAAPCPK